MCDLTNKKERFELQLYTYSTLYPIGKREEKKATYLFCNRLDLGPNSYQHLFKRLQSTKCAGFSVIKFDINTPIHSDHIATHFYTNIPYIVMV